MTLIHSNDNLIAVFVMHFSNDAWRIGGLFEIALELAGVLRVS